MIILDNDTKAKLQQFIKLHMPVSATDFKCGVQMNYGERKQHTKKTADLYDELIKDGFKIEDIETCLRSIPPENLDSETALDWLIFNLPTAQLPEKFSHETRNGEGLKVVAKRREDSTETKRSASSARENAMEDDLVSVKVIKGIKEKDEAKLKPSDWILRYVEQNFDDDSEIDDWEDMADSRNSQHRFSKREDMSTDEYIQSAVKQYTQAKEMAAQAKTAGNQMKQREAGKVIASLKAEFSRLGIAESALIGSMASQPQEILQPERIQAAEPVSQPALGSIDDCLTISGVDQELLLADDSATGHGKQQIPEVLAPVDAVTEEEEVEIGGFFEEPAAEEALPETVLRLQKEAERKLMWGAMAASKGKKVDSSPVMEKLFPKSQLQKLCQQNGWIGPNFSKVQGAATDRKYRYSVSISRPDTGRGKSRQTGGPVTFQIPSAMDGFNSISEAQHAVSTLALYSLTTTHSLSGPIPLQYQDLWMQFHDQGVPTVSQGEAGKNSRRDAFVSALVSQWASGDAAGIADGSRGEGVDGIRAEESRKRGFVPRAGATEAENRRLYNLQVEKQAWPQFQALAEARACLPMAAMKEAFLQALQQSNVVVVSGETGSGKTTQIPQYILDEFISRQEGAECNIICTQPRRIAAVSVAERVAHERCEPPPGREGSLVGYQVRLDSCRSSTTRLLFCTTGILLRQLAGDKYLDNVTHVIVDEVHERTMQGDFLMAILKVIVGRRRDLGMPPLKLVLMSATLDSQLFAHYFGDCPVVHSKGRTFPVETHFLEDIYAMMNYRLLSESPASLNWTAFRPSNKQVSGAGKGRVPGRGDLAGQEDESILEETVLNPHFSAELYAGCRRIVKDNLRHLNENVVDYDLLEALICFIDENFDPGAILVFLPGIGEINSLRERLCACRQFAHTKSEWVLALHSTVSPDEQQRVFKSPPAGCRKVILSTNIAETSITIDDAVYVVDSGKLKEVRFDSKKGMSSLEEAWISRASSMQRRGRAGRVRPGKYFALFTQHRLEHLMHPHQIPEMQRVPLVELCLQVKLLQLGGAHDFLQNTIQPPKAEAIDSGVNTLREVGALDGAENLTSLGRLLALLPVDVKVGKLMIYGALLGCVSPILTVAACLSYRSPFSTDEHQRAEAELARATFASKPHLPKDGLREGEISLAGIARGQQSDHLVQVAAYHGWREAAEKSRSSGVEFCRKHFLSRHTLEMLSDMRQQFARLLCDAGLIPMAKGSNSVKEYVDSLAKPCNRFSMSPHVIKAILLAGLYPNIASLQQQDGLLQSRPTWSDVSGQVFIHPSSINHLSLPASCRFLVFHEKVKTSKVFIRECTPVSAYTMLLFGGSLRVEHRGNRVRLDEWVDLRVEAHTGVLVKKFRQILNELLMSATVKEDIARPQAADLAGIMAHLLLIEEQKTGAG